MKHQGMTAFVLCCLVTGALGQADWLSYRMGEKSPEVEYSFLGYLEDEVEGQSEDLPMHRHELGVSAPLHQTETSEWLMRSSVVVWGTDSRAVFPGSGADFPDHLADVRLGTTYRQTLENNWLWGVDFALGSPSDRPYASGEEITVALNAFLRIPQSDEFSWVVLLNVSNGKEFWDFIPLPGAGAYYHPSRDLQVLAGVPMSFVRWTPGEKWELLASYFLLRNIHAKVGYDLVDNVQLYARYDWDNEKFFRYDRMDDDHHLFYYDMRIAGGVRWDIVENLAVDFSGGYAFERFWYEEDDYDDRRLNRLNLADGAFLAASITWSF